MTTTIFRTSPEYKQAIRDDPNDYDARLQYSDWLEERGETTHARFQREWVKYERRPGKSEQLSWWYGEPNNKAYQGSAYTISYELFLLIPIAICCSTSKYFRDFRTRDEAEAALLTAYRKLAEECPT